MESILALAVKIIESRLTNKALRICIENQDTMTFYIGFKILDDQNINRDVTTEIATACANKICDDIQDTAQLCKEKRHPEKSCEIVLFQSDYKCVPASQEHHYTFKFKVYFN